jgi:bacteriorhodopsin
VTALFPAFFTGWIATAALLALMHLLWKDAPREVRYLLGGGAICGGCSLTGLVLDQALLTFGPWVISSSGLLIVAWTVYDRHHESARKAAQKQGEIVGAARGLTQELIDAGGQGRAQRPSHDRQN